MLVNYEEHGFMVAADEIPESCTACPFWVIDMNETEEGMCYITGHIITANGDHDKKRMDDCQIIQRREEWE